MHSLKDLYQTAETGCREVFFAHISEWFVKIKATHFQTTSVVCVYPPGYPKFGVSDSEAFWCWQKITSYQLHQTGPRGRYPHPFFPWLHHFLEHSIKLAICESFRNLSCVARWVWTDLWGEWLLLWRPIRSPVRWATVAEANLRQGGWNEGKRGNVAKTKYITCWSIYIIYIYIYIYTCGILLCINLTLPTHCTHMHKLISEPLATDPSTKTSSQ